MAFIVEHCLHACLLHIAQSTRRSATKEMSVMQPFMQNIQIGD